MMQARQLNVQAAVPPVLRSSRALDVSLKAMDIRKTDSFRKHGGSAVNALKGGMVLRTFQTTFQRFDFCLKGRG